MRKLKLGGQKCPIREACLDSSPSPQFQDPELDPVISHSELLACSPPGLLPDTSSFHVELSQTIWRPSPLYLPLAWASVQTSARAQFLLSGLTLYFLFPLVPPWSSSFSSLFQVINPKQQECPSLFIIYHFSNQKGFLLRSSSLSSTKTHHQALWKSSQILASLTLLDNLTL